ncbi:hypothetical protein M3654_23715, partial [Bacillus licheniformis]|nr:hypothetical protein [Bacillus licheniformis]
AALATVAPVCVWLLILLSQVAMRRRLSSAEVAPLTFKVPLWPVAPALPIAVMGFVIVMLGWFDDSRVALYVGAAWHALLGQYRHEGFVSLAFRDARRGRWAATAAGFYLHGQIEAGTLCPATMTQAAIPVLQKEPALWDLLRDKLYSDAYDAR